MEGSFERRAEARQHHSELRRTAVHSAGLQARTLRDAFTPTEEDFIQGEPTDVSLIMSNGSFQQWWNVVLNSITVQRQCECIPLTTLVTSYFKLY